MSPPRPNVTVVGRRLEPEDYRLRDFLTRAAQPHEFYEAGTPQADEVLDNAGAREAALPVVLDGDVVYAAATVERLAEDWKVFARPKRSHYDLFIVGAGPAGLAAAVYGASDGLSTAVSEADLPGGQASYTSMIENFFGFEQGIGGAELARKAGRQAEGFGAELLILNGVVDARLVLGEPPVATLSSGDQVTADITLVAPGMEWRRLEAEGVNELVGHGVYYGAGRSEAVQCAGEHVMVVGAGNSAGQAVMNMVSAGATVTMVVRGDSLSKSMSAYLVERIEASDAVDVRLRTQVRELHDEAGRVVAVTLESADTAPDAVRVTSVFLCIGGVPRTRWARRSDIRTDDKGFLLTGPDLLENGRRPEGWPLDRDPLALETSIPGLFVAGDARHGSVKRVAGAVGEGAMAVSLAHHRLDELARPS
ncbi:MAG TPA: NAD(P)/FAD-dependent oxidoreductase [Thermoleophilaceae bacterium]|nr:NAD(P)/FAD-dependent oxidoreductase [Thermoleophilaceae bacterium]